MAKKVQTKKAALKTKAKTKKLNKLEFKTEHCNRPRSRHTFYRIVHHVICHC